MLSAPIVVLVSEHGPPNAPFLPQSATRVSRFQFNDHLTTDIFMFSSSHPTEPACAYDPVEGLRPVSKPAPDPSERVRVLETEICMQLAIS